MAPTRAEQAQKTRKTILATSRRQFHEHGYDATSLQQIADAMGVTKANVYYYFRTKAAILEALLAPMSDGLRALLDAAETIEDRGARTALLVDGYIAQVVVSYRTIGPLNLGDPAMRREVAITSELNALAHRGLHVIFGEKPTPDQQAAYWLVNDLAPVLRRLAHLPDEQLSDTLTKLCLRVLNGAMP
jgi:AcrR family transcriptional regulator